MHIAALLGLSFGHLSHKLVWAYISSYIWRKEFTLVFAHWLYLLIDALACWFQLLDTLRLFWYATYTWSFFQTLPLPNFSIQGVIAIIGFCYGGLYLEDMSYFYGDLSINVFNCLLQRRPVNV